MNYDLDEKTKKQKDELRSVFTAENMAAAAASGSTVRHFVSLLGGTSYLSDLGRDGRFAKNAFDGVLGLAAAGEEAARLSPSLFLGLAHSLEIFGWLVARLGSPQQRKTFLAPLLEGKLLGCAAMREHAGSFDSGAVNMPAGIKGDDRELTGKKSQVALARHADAAIVPARAVDGVVLLIVPLKSDGLTLGPDAGCPGFPDLGTCDIDFSGCRVTPDRIMEPPAGSDIMAEMQAREDLILAVACMGVMTRAFTEALGRADKKEQGAKPAMAFQEFRYRLAEMFALIRTSRLLLWRAAWMLQENEHDAAAVLACAKVFVTETAEAVVSAAHQVMGPRACEAGSGMDRALMAAKSAQVWGRSSEALRMSIAESMVGV
jgi:butyryl-CoA dehydrogenase